MALFLVISDKKGIDDYYEGVANKLSKWDAKPNYLLNKLLLVGNHNALFFNYAEKGFEKKLATKITRESIIVWHIDKTFIPKNIIKIMEKYSQKGIKSINSQITNISKKDVDKVCRTFGLRSLTLDKKSNYKGKVMVKRNFNSFEP